MARFFRRTGDKEVTFNAIITSFEESAAVNEMATYNITGSTGAITEAFILIQSILQAWHLPLRGAGLH